MSRQRLVRWFGYREVWTHHAVLLCLCAAQLHALPQPQPLRRHNQQARVGAKGRGQQRLQDAQGGIQGQPGIHAAVPVRSRAISALG